MDLKEINYKQSIEAIEDLKSLVASDFKGVADQALFHVQELKYKYDYDWSLNQAGYQAVRELLEGQLKGLFNFYVSTNKTMGKVHFKHDANSFSLTAWNRLLNSLDLVLRSLSFFRFYGDLRIELKNNRLIVTGNLRKFDCVGEMRIRLYTVIRQFLLKETIFTYELDESADGNAHLALIFDYSHKDSEQLSFNTAHGALTFTSALAGYEVKNLNRLQGLNHYVLVVDESYQLSIESFIPERYFQAFTDGKVNFSVFHFSFLFRPVSLIIPMRGEIQIPTAKSGTFVDLFSIINN